MSNTVILTIIVVASFAAGLHAARQLLRPANTLGLSLFRPYRGDAWPRGVQEEYDVHFDWTPPKSAPVPIQPTWSDIVVAPTGGERDLTTFADAVVVEVEDLHGEIAAISPVRGDVRIAPH